MQEGGRAAMAAFPLKQDRTQYSKVIFAVYPATYHDRVVVHCMQHQAQKAFGKAGNMVDVLSGEGWTPEWESRIVIATVTKAQPVNSK